MRAAVFLLAAAGLVWAQAKKDEPSVRRITLQEAIDLGLAYNLGLKSSRISAILARLEVREAEAAWDPTLTSSAGGGEELFPARSELSGADIVDIDNFNFALGVSKPFRVGPTLGVNWRTDRAFSNSSFATINPSYDTALEVTLTVPLLRGRGRTVQEADLRASLAGAQGARLSLEDDASTLIQDVAAAFWDLAYFEYRVQVLEKSYNVAKEIEDNERRKLRPDIGRSTQLDVTTAEAETKRREAALIRGRMDAADAADDLRLLILPFGGGDTDRVVLHAVVDLKEGAQVPDLDGLVKMALARRPDLLRTDTELAQLEQEVVKARDALRLQLDLNASIIWRGVARDFRDASRQSVQGDTPSANATVSLTWTMGRRAARAALRRAQLRLEQARIDRRAQVSTIIVEVRKAHRQLSTTLEELVATREEVRAATAALAGERLRLGRGSSTVLDVTQLEENLTQAELRLLQVRADLEKARVNIHRVSGRMLEQFGVAVGPGARVKRAKGENAGKKKAE